MAYDTFHLSLTAAPPWSLCSSHTAINTPSLRGLRWRWHLPETLIPCSDARHRKLGSSHFQTHALISSLWTWKMFMVVKTSSLASFKVQLSHLFLLFFLFLDLVISLHWILVAAWELLGLCSLRPGIEPRPPVLGAWSLSHWTTREVPKPPPKDAFCDYTSCPQHTPSQSLCLLWPNVISLILPFQTICLSFPLRLKAGTMSCSESVTKSLQYSTCSIQMCGTEFNSVNGQKIVLECEGMNIY